MECQESLYDDGGWPNLSRFRTEVAPPLSLTFLERQGGNTIGVNEWACSPWSDSPILRHRTAKGWGNLNKAIEQKGWASPRAYLEREFDDSEVEFNGPVSACPG